MPARRLDPRPLLVLGEDEGTVTFGTVVGAIRLSDGSVVVADGKARELRLFEAAGRLVRTVARRGEGPGDLERFGGLLRLPGDTILLWDIQLNRLTRFSRSGLLVRTTLVDRLPTVRHNSMVSSTPSIMLLGAFSDGTLLGSYTGMRLDPPTALYRDTLSLARITPPSAVSTIGAVQIGEVYVFESSATGLLSSDIRPFTTGGKVAAGTSSFWFHDGRRFELREFTPSGALKTIVRLARTPAPVTPKEIAAHRADLIASAKADKDPDPAMRARSLEQSKLIGKWLSFPATHPAFTGLVVASTGEVWAREHGDSTKAQRWHVFAATGVRTATIELPAGVEPLEVGRDYVLARVRNEDDVESVRVYRYQR